VRSPSTVTSSLPSSLAPALLRWYRRARRPLPWRRDRDPYRVWVAEVLLQQTRVEQAAPYFERFLTAFPTIAALARAPRARVLKVWEGAGYYARAHHLHEAARRLVRERAGRLPSTVAELEELPGVGPYIARAVAAIAFDRAEVALEANGLRVAARWTREERDVRSAAVRARMGSVLAPLLPPDSPGEFNEAVMELGETVCVPVGPRCGRCPVSFACRAYAELDDPGALPMRAPAPPRPHVRASVVVLRAGGRWLVQRRPATGLLPGLWEFPGGRIEPGESPESAARRELAEETGVHVEELLPIGTVRHAYSHFSVELHAFAANPGPRSGVGSSLDRRWVTRAEFDRLAVPKATEKVVRLLESVPGTAFPGSGSRRGRTPASRPRAARPRLPRAPR